MRIISTCIVAALMFPAASFAACVGTGAFQTCNDASGNSYSVQRFGNTTSVQGYNAETGSSWSQNSYRSGNTTNTYGTAADGSSWNSTTIRSPGMVQQFGSDSDGNSFSRTCTAAGCY